MTEVYVSTDIETDGPLPGPNSMLSFGSAAFTLEKGHVDSFSANLHQLPGAPSRRIYISYQEQWRIPSQRLSFGIKIQRLGQLVEKVYSTHKML